MGPNLSGGHADTITFSSRRFHCCSLEANSSELLFDSFRSRTRSFNSFCVSCVAQKTSRLVQNQDLLMLMAQVNHTFRHLVRLLIPGNMSMGVLEREALHRGVPDAQQMVYLDSLRSTFFKYLSGLEEPWRSNSHWRDLSGPSTPQARQRAWIVFCDSTSCESLLHKNCSKYVEPSSYPGPQSYSQSKDCRLSWCSEARFVDAKVISLFERADKTLSVQIKRYLCR
jgi:hypothetical protein